MQDAHPEQYASALRMMRTLRFSPEFMTAIYQVGLLYKLLIARDLMHAARHRPASTLRCATRISSVTVVIRNSRSP